MIYVGCYRNTGFIQKAKHNNKLASRTKSCNLQVLQLNDERQPAEVHGGRDEEATDAKGGKVCTGASITFADMYTRLELFH